MGLIPFFFFRLRCTISVNDRNTILINLEKMTSFLLLELLLGVLVPSFLIHVSNGFIVLPASITTTTPPMCISTRRYGINNNKNTNPLNENIVERSRQRAAATISQQGAAGSTAAGAVLGGMMGGPFGALFGASIGNNLGTKKAFDDAKKQELAQLGVTEEMLTAAEDVGFALEQAMVGMAATRDSLRTQQSLAKTLEQAMNDQYAQATRAMTEGKEEYAKQLLLERNTKKEQYIQVLKLCAEEKERMNVMEQNVKVLQQRASTVETLLQRAVGAKTAAAAATVAGSSSSLDDDITSSSTFALNKQDPLLKKFQDIGID